jgi:hypothetical protein
LAQKYRELGTLAVRRELALPIMACFPVLLSFVAMYSGVLMVRLAALPAMLLAPLAG